MQELRLDEGEIFVLAALQVLMLDRDLEADKRTPSVKTEVREKVVSTASSMLEQLSPNAPDWVLAFAADQDSSAAAVDSAPHELGHNVTERSHAVSMLIELMLYRPWPDSKIDWVSKVRSRSLREAAGSLPALRDNDLDIMEREYRVLMRRLRRASVKWGRVALVSAAGLGLGVVTAGWAAPFIGAAVGGAMGLSGAAATSAGLAALGGGSLAAGGFGVAGGTALLTGLGGAAGASAAALGARLSPWSAGQVIVDAIELDLYTRMVLADDDEQARRVVETLHQRITDLGTVAAQLAERIQELSKDNARLTAENKELRKRLEHEYEDTRRAGTALEIVADRMEDHRNAALEDEGEGAA